MVLLHILEETSFAVVDNSCDGVSLAALWLGLLLFFATFLLTAGEVCPGGFYVGNSTEEEVCLPCSVCEAGEGTVEPCGAFSDTVCTPCPAETFSRLNSSGVRECVKCRSCSPERTVVSACTPTRDSECGSCAAGFFLLFDGRVSECVPSIKPSTPGESTSGYVVQPTLTVARATGKTRLPTNHGTFVPMKNYDVLDTTIPLESDTERHIAIVSLVFTAVTTATFVVAISCLFRDRIYLSFAKGKEKANYRILCWRKYKKVKLPIQAVNHHSEETVFIHGFDELPTNTRTHSFS